MSLLTKVTSGQPETGLIAELMLERFPNISNDYSIDDLACFVRLLVPLCSLSAFHTHDSALPTYHLPVTFALDLTLLNY